ncbi:class-II aminoacyl-tRNA synthetase family protein [Burkholderia pseudomallei]|uniref:hypothetical protein n=1 Tax=Burkholderia pseudomallei TaxID=28450 RepID=UPI000977F962|nr:hypothetical protein [Burkholderia pseudomallei]MBO7811596.1 hypothetical protein [Burkholderia pseudomallei]OMW11468.1 hypothetical protein AQ804_05720 [Burkholderia pseudomallei]OMW25951.1 hypothetical protein AQ805_23665 [Burkholderia pseudomallei]ONF04807.1 hypothetical protein AQ961_04890 [Burkholderia pseudomallei]ONF15487.1 hypothetical protein AQ962_30240 [Burkholderia pseudomallei]
MTCEVAVLNKYAVVLAADSAVTTTDGNGEERYSKGGNKIFQLSHSEPVGVMIFGAASICGMPWEVVIKAYRAEHLQQNIFDSVEEYAKNFFSFLQSAASPISAELREASLVAYLQDAVLQILTEVEKLAPAIRDSSLPVSDRAAQASSALDTITQSIEAEPYGDTDLEEEARRLAAGPPQALQDALDEGLQTGGIADVISTNRLIELASNRYFRSYEHLLAPTGVVFAGYGKMQYFPAVVEYAVTGFVGSRFVYKKERQSDISIGTPSEILPFAISSAVDAFMRGVGLDVFVAVGEAYKRFAAEFARSILSQAQAQEPTNLEDEVAKSTKLFRQAWYGQVLQSHYHSLKRVIASLPMEEMTHLAETLVTLESLKEKVTSPKQSVGGPIDVAVITKSEGLVWIKRKHFFDSDKNLRFILRQRAFYQ